MNILKGYIEPLYIATKEMQVFLSVDGKEYGILHKGAGVDLADLLGNYMEVSYTPVETSEDGEVQSIFVRSYTILEE